MPKYIGEGRAYYPGIPNRDMSDEQWEELSPEMRAKLVEWGFFEEEGNEPDSIPFTDSIADTDMGEQDDDS